MKAIRIIILMLASLLAVNAWSQWQWMDKDGKKVYSDRAPPADVLDKQIIKQPGGRARISEPIGTATTAATPVAAVTPGKADSPSAAASAPKPSGVDKELADKKKKAADAATAQRKAEEDKQQLAKAENCKRAKGAKASIESGVRLARTNAAGERTLLDDADRAVELKRIQGILDADCK